MVAVSVFPTGNFILPLSFQDLSLCPNGIKIFCQRSAASRQLRSSELFIFR
jgi:hypothetical protein